MNEGVGEDRRAEETCRVMFENLQDAVLTIDLNYEIITANPAALDLEGYGRDELAGENVTRSCTATTSRAPRFRARLRRFWKRKKVKK